MDEPDEPGDVRPATASERANVELMHDANRTAWDEAAERYERWLPEAIELIRSGGSNLFPVERELIGDLHGRCRRAIHLQCAGGRDTPICSMCASRRENSVGGPCSCVTPWLARSSSVSAGSKAVRIKSVAPA